MKPQEIQRERSAGPRGVTDGVRKEKERLTAALLININNLIFNYSKGDGHDVNENMMLWTIS